MITCPACNKLFTPKYKNSRFCSLPCSYKTINKEISERKNKEYLSNPKKCKICDNFLTIQQYRNKNIYCSKSCAKIETNKAISRCRHQNKNCLNCSSIFKIGRNSNAKFCSRLCSTTFNILNKSRERIFRGDKKIRNPALKKFLIVEYGEQCNICNQLPIHNGKYLCLQVDHIDGNSDNNFPENLRLLCPNCHTQTETYGSKNTSNSSRNIARKIRRKI